PYGQHLLLSGESGAGKSSLVNLLLRFADYEQGAIRLGGHDLRAIPHETLRRTFAVMSQNTYLFNTTIGENIRIGRKTAVDADVVAAARQAQVHDFIAGLPRQYDTYVGEGGVRLSGGERQRIALARMLLRQAPIWILDEPTANLDPATAVAVLDTLFTTGAPKTILLLSHRPELAGRFAFDQILTIRDGQAVAAFPSP
ncbi:MAG: ABC transporter ATP-binding protein, partial [Anaerolineales bacterium]|nr:ABC transporter ATP-binding protein [Anaerolineales bacterium]